MHLALLVILKITFESKRKNSLREIFNAFEFYAGAIFYKKISLKTNDHFFPCFQSDINLLILIFIFQSFFSCHCKFSCL